MAYLECKSLSEVLGQELSKRKQRNSSYTLRAFARDMGISPSRLSEVLSGKHGLSEPSLDTLAKRIGAKPKEQIFLKDLTLSQFSRNAMVRKLALKRIEELRKNENYRRLQEDQFRVISDWYHGAILELIQVRGFKSDPRWIAERIGVSHSSVESALTRMSYLGMIKKDKAGNWKATPEAFSAFSEIPSRAVRKFHLQALNLSATSLNDDPMEEREFISTFLAIPKSRLPELQQELQNFVTQFWQKFAEDTDKDDLYLLSLQFSPVRNRLKKRSEQ